MCWAAFAALFHVGGDDSGSVAVRYAPRPACRPSESRLDIFREPHDAGTWIYRRDDSIRRPYQQIIMTSPDGVPYLAPEIVLLFKAEHDRAKDQSDLAGVLPLLDPVRRAWLAGALRRVHPGHRWIGAL